MKNLNLQSEYNDIKNYMYTEQIDTIEFSESPSPEKKKQSGGTNVNMPNYSEKYDNFQRENEMFAIFEKARNYRDRVNEKKQDGGKNKSGENKSGENKKRVINKTLALMLNLTKIMKNHNKYQQLKQKDFMKISKMILDDAKNANKTTELTDAVIKKAEELANQTAEELANQTTEELAKNPNIYIQKLLNESAQKVTNTNDRSFSRHLETNSTKNNRGIVVGTNKNKNNRLNSVNKNNRHRFVSKKK